MPHLFSAAVVCKMVLRRSSGAVAVRDTAPAAPPATSCFHQRSPDNTVGGSTVRSYSPESEMRLQYLVVRGRGMRGAREDGAKNGTRAMNLPDEVNDVARRRKHHVFPPLVPSHGLLVRAADLSQHAIDLSGYHSRAGRRKGGTT